MLVLLRVNPHPSASIDVIEKTRCLPGNGKIPKTCVRGQGLTEFGSLPRYFAVIIAQMCWKLIGPTDCEQNHTATPKGI
jgi:hypothetical protein